MTDLVRAYHKADSFVAAWLKRYGELPPKSTVILGMCQPSAETRVGDAWPGPDGILYTADDCRNWGATTVRQCTAAELAAIKAAGITPSVGPDHEARAQAATAALEAAGLGFVPGTYRGVLVPRAELHCDSKTVLVDGKKTQVPYFVWFAAFDLDDQGLETASAEYYLSFVADAGNPARAVLLNPKGTVYDLAAAAYARGYFYGFKPHGHYFDPGPDGVLGTADDVDHDGNAENVKAYGAWLAPHFVSWTAALKDWQPAGGAAPPPAPSPVAFSLADEAGIWSALRVLGCVRPAELAYTERRYVAALGFYQGGSLGVDGKLLDVDGGAGNMTKAALARDLRALGFEVTT